jgi:hypothetical protein
MAARLSDRPVVAIFFAHSPSCSLDAVFGPGVIWGTKGLRKGSGNGRDTVFSVLNDPGYSQYILRSQQSW